MANFADVASKDGRGIALAFSEHRNLYALMDKPFRFGG